MLPSPSEDNVRNLKLCSLLAVALLLAGCGGGGGTRTPAPDPPPDPKAVLTTIAVSPAAFQLTVGSTQQYTAKGYDKLGGLMGGITFTFSSSNTGIAAVASSGTATGVSPGFANISASANRITGTANVTVVPVTPPPPISVLTSITITPLSATVQVGHTLTFTASAFDQNSKPMVVLFNWASSGASASVDIGGTATGVSSGVVQITASSGSITSPPASLTVANLAPPPTILRLSPPLALTASNYSIPLTIVGTGFDANTEVNGFSSVMTPESFTPTKLTVTVPASELTTDNVVSVTVSNSNGTSNALPFTIAKQGFVSLPFDDGYQSSYDYGFPIFDKAQIPYTWYIITHAPAPGNTYDASWAEITTVSQKPWVEIGNHTQTHAGVTSCPIGDTYCPNPWPVDDQGALVLKFLTILGANPVTITGSDSGLDPVGDTLTAETLGAQQDLQFMGFNPTTFAYPYGDYDMTSDPSLTLPFSQQRVELALQAIPGMQGARTVDFGYVTTGVNPYSLQTFTVDATVKLPAIENYITPALPGHFDPTMEWAIVTFHQVDEAGPDSVPHTLLQGLIDYLVANKIPVVTVNEGLIILNLNGQNYH
jgi:peptidoglycan/xylan/chitin deacetylase (PgdA/CDA1 family)